MQTAKVVSTQYIIVDIFHSQRLRDSAVKYLWRLKMSYDEMKSLATEFRADLDSHGAGEERAAKACRAARRWA